MYTWKIHRNIYSSKERIQLNLNSHFQVYKNKFHIQFKLSESCSQLSTESVFCQQSGSANFKAVGSLYVKLTSEPTNSQMLKGCQLIL